MHSFRRIGFVQNKLSYIGYLTGFFFTLELHIFKELDNSFN